VIYSTMDISLFPRTISLVWKFQWSIHIRIKHRKYMNRNLDGFLKK
jgi:hypothetical protein